MKRWRNLHKNEKQPCIKHDMKKINFFFPFKCKVSFPLFFTNQLIAKNIKRREGSPFLKVICIEIMPCKVKERNFWMKYSLILTFHLHII